MLGAFQIVVRREEKALEVSYENIIERKQRVDQERINVLEALPATAGFVRRKSKNAAPRKCVVLGVKVDAGVVPAMMQDTPHV